MYVRADSCDSWIHSMESLVPLGDQAALAYFADEAAALRFAATVRQANEPWIVDVVHAYVSVAVFFDGDRTTYGRVAESLRRLDAEGTSATVPAARLHHIPCCYA